MPSESLLLWHARGPVGDHARELRCTLDQLAEGCFELRVRAGGLVLLSETFSSTERILQRAAELRLAMAPTRTAGPRGHH